MNELPEHRKAIHGTAHKETFDHARGSMTPEGPYRRTIKHPVLWILIAAILFSLTLIGLAL
jgi:hypothetical protein